ncbi:hypothetical protein [Enterococcus sp. AZ163]|uniref:hypothetical protein n=1 Tax=Enterococcus sp. AZ163 TaxID=2774638 RepID=UPI003D2C6DA6
MAIVLLNYSSAFKQNYATSPSTYKQFVTAPQASNPFIAAKLEKFSSYEDYQEKIEIEQLPDQLVYFERFIGNYAELKQHWLFFLKEHQGKIHGKTLLQEKFYSDPVSADVDRCICDLCFSVDQVQDGTTTIKGGTYAIYAFEGNIEDIFNVL